MRILFVITRSVPIGGAQIHVRDLAIRLKEQGHEVRVLVGFEGLFQNMFRTALTYANVDNKRVAHFQQPIHPLFDLRALTGL